MNARDNRTSALQSWLDRPWALSVWSITAAFGAYFCMYAFRKPFTSVEYHGQTVGNVDFKTAIVIAQVFGYAVSKIIGVKVIAEMTPRFRAVGILLLISIAEGALLLFAVVESPFLRIVFLFCNGLPLGMVFGLVLGFLEGRRVTEALTAGLCASFILADGVVKSIGAGLVQYWHVPTFWMPATAGALFFGPLVLFTWMLAQIPLPTVDDIAARTERVPMNRASRWQFFRRHAGGLSALIVAYLLITILRSLRGDFGAEIWSGLGYEETPELFALSESMISLGIMIVFGLNILIVANRRAFSVAMAISLAGPILSGLALLLFSSGAVGGFTMVVLVGLGLYLPYVAVHTTLFERLIAMTRDRANIGYLLYLADAIGYLGYVAVLVVKNWLRAPEDKTRFLDFFLNATGLISIATFACLALCWFYFARTGQNVVEHEPEVAPAPQRA